MNPYLNSQSLPSTNQIIANGYTLKQKAGYFGLPTLGIRQNAVSNFWTSNQQGIPGDRGTMWTR